MKTKYYEYNTNPNGEKYMEVTKDEFQRDVIETEGRFYISFGPSVLECNEKEYRRYANERNRHKYLSQNGEKKKVSIVPIDDVNEQAIAIDDWVDEFLERVVMDEGKNKLKIALSKLSEHERFLVIEYFYKERTQDAIADKIGESQQNISYQIKACLVKLAELIKN